MNKKFNNIKIMQFENIAFWQIIELFIIGKVDYYFNNNSAYLPLQLINKKL